MGSIKEHEGIEVYLSRVLSVLFMFKIIKTNRKILSFLRFPQNFKVFSDAEKFRIRRLIPMR